MLLPSPHCYKRCQWAAIALLPLDLDKREGRRRGDGKKKQNGGMGKEKEMGGRKGHLSPFIQETMINGLAFSWSVLPQCFLWASSDKRVFEGEWTLQILLFV